MSQKRMSGSKIEGATKGWKKLHNEIQDMKYYYPRVEAG
jgi:hypothetical protein